MTLLSKASKPVLKMNQLYRIDTDVIKDFKIVGELGKLSIYDWKQSKIEEVINDTFNSSSRFPSSTRRKSYIITYNFQLTPASDGFNICMYSDVWKAYILHIYVDPVRDIVWDRDIKKDPKPFDLEPYMIKEINKINKINIKLQKLTETE